MSKEYDNAYAKKGPSQYICIHIAFTDRRNTLLEKGEGYTQGICEEKI